MGSVSLFRISLPDSPYTLSSSEPNRQRTQIMLSSDAEDRPRRKRARVTRRASTNAAYLPFLRILKRDIRRKYADMMNNTFNLYDPELVSKFFTTFAIPDFRYSDTVTEEIERKTVFRSAYVQGVQSILRLYVTPAYMLPDLLVRLESVRVCKRSDEPGSRVLSKVSMRGTLLYIPKVPINSVTVDDEGNVDRSQFQPQSPPKTVHLEGICVMHLDENHHIRVLEVVIDKLLE